MANKTVTMLVAPPFQRRYFISKAWTGMAASFLRCYTTASYLSPSRKTCSKATRLFLWAHMLEPIPSKVEEGRQIKAKATSDDETVQN